MPYTAPMVRSHPLDREEVEFRVQVKRQDCDGESRWNRLVVGVEATPRWKCFRKSLFSRAFGVRRRGQCPAPRKWNQRGCTSDEPGDVERANSRQLGGSRPNIATCRCAIPRSSTAAPLHGNTQPLERHHLLPPRCDWPVDGLSLQLNGERPHTRTAMPVGPICSCQPERPERIVKRASGGPVSQLLVHSVPPIVGFSGQPKPIAAPLLLSCHYSNLRRG